MSRTLVQLLELPDLILNLPPSSVLCSHSQPTSILFCRRSSKPSKQQLVFTKLFKYSPTTNIHISDCWKYSKIPPTIQKFYRVRTKKNYFYSVTENNLRFNWWVCKAGNQNLISPQNISLPNCQWDKEQQWAMAYNSGTGKSCDNCLSGKSHFIATNIFHDSL